MPLNSPSLEAQSASKHVLHVLAEVSLPASMQSDSYSILLPLSSSHLLTRKLLCVKRVQHNQGNDFLAYILFTINLRIPGSIAQC